MMAQESPPEALSVLEVAAECGVHPETVRRWAREGRVPARKFGNTIFILAADVEELMKKTKERKYA